MSNTESSDRSRLVMFVGLLVAFALGIVFQSGVGGSPAPTPLPTFTAAPTYTSYPTYTPLPSSTETHTATATAAVTLTFTPTDTPSNTPTNTTTATPTYTSTSTPTYTATSTHTATMTYTPTHTSTPTMTPIPPARILEGIKESGQLITVKAERALVGLEVRYPANIACEYSAKHAVVGVIEAGIDLETIGADDIRCDDFLCTSYTITLPQPEISSCRLDFIDQYTQLGGGTATCFANEWMDMEDIARHLAMKRFVPETQEDELLRRSGDRAALVLRNFVRELTGSRVHIQFAESLDTPIIPDSCNPQLPQGWEKDREGKWRKTG